MRMLEGILQAQLDIMESLYSDDPDIVFEQLRRRPIAHAKEQRELTKKSRELVRKVKKLKRDEKS